jgi:hypothetical protein
MALPRQIHVDQKAMGSWRADPLAEPLNFKFESML